MPTKCNGPLLWAPNKKWPDLRRCVFHSHTSSTRCTMCGCMVCCFGGPLFRCMVIPITLLTWFQISLTTLVYLSPCNNPTPTYVIFVSVLYPFPFLVLIIVSYITWVLCYYTCKSYCLSIFSTNNICWYVCCENGEWKFPRMKTQSVSIILRIHNWAVSLQTIAKGTIQNNDNNRPSLGMGDEPALFQNSPMLRPK